MNADQKFVPLTPYSGSNRGGNPSESDIAETAHSASLSDIQNRRCGHGLTAGVQSSATDYYGAELVRNPDGALNSIEYEEIKAFELFETFSI